MSMRIYNKYNPKREVITVPSGLDNQPSKTYMLPRKGRKIMRGLPILFFVIILIICSCSTTEKVGNVLKGGWSMDTIYYKNYDIRICLGSNWLEFKDDSKLEVPAAQDNCGPIIKSSYTSNTEIEVLESDIPNDTIPLRLKIITKNEVFAGVHKLVFYKDEPNQLLKMEIFSDSLYIVCRKGLFNFNKNIALINELEEISWTNRPKSQ